MKSYGISSQNINNSVFDTHLEQIQTSGFTILKNVFSETELTEVRARLDFVYAQQIEEFGKENLATIKELNLARCLLAYDDFFIKLITLPIIKPYLEAILGKHYILHLQNGIINMPNEEHHQSSWHRDLPYQNFTISAPLALNAFYCIDDFSEQTGSTYLLPYSHSYDYVPSKEFMESNKIHIQANAGSLVLFNSMLLHKAGYNSSQNIRRGINNVFVKPLLKQQINLPKVLDGKFSDDLELSAILGYTTAVSDSVIEYRNKRIKNS